MRTAKRACSAWHALVSSSMRLRLRPSWLVTAPSSLRVPSSCTDMSSLDLRVADSCDCASVS